MKNFMILIWDVLDGSGVNELLGKIYKGATLRSILNVHHFNKSLRCCKLLYTALSILLIEQFLTTSPLPDQILSVLSAVPNGYDYLKNETKQKWFKDLTNELKKVELSDVFTTWAVGCSQQNITFKFWLFVLQCLFEPLIELNMAIRTSNFSARNGSLSKMAPLFFANNHRNYARLFAQHFFDLRSSSASLLQHLARSFAVNRTQRPFSYIAMDQTIECTINKHGKSHGGISGRFNEQSINNWTNSFAYRAILSTVTNEIAGLETSKNTIDSHIECQPNRVQVDNEDLSTIVSKLNEENLFSFQHQHCRILSSGELIHGDIINNICSSFERGLEALKTYTEQRLVNKSVTLDEPLRAMRRLRIRDNDTYTAGVAAKGRASSKKQNNINQITKTVDEYITRIIILAECRNLDITELFSYEFTDAPLSLCDKDNWNFMNQQTKADALNFLRDKFPTAFSRVCPITFDQCALIVDGGSLLEIRPSSKHSTVYDYAAQLLQNVIIQQFKSFDRIDIVFDSHISKALKAYTQRHGNDNMSNKYDLKKSDLLASKYHEFVHGNRAVLAKCMSECWREPALVQLLPDHKVLVVAGPSEEAIILKKDVAPGIIEELECNHIEADTRMLLHAQVIQSTYVFKKVIIQATDTDVILLCIANAKIIGLEALVVKSLNTTTKVHTYINSIYIAQEIIDKWHFDPSVLLTLHALSGCDTTSFIRNITKTNF
ncbi:unnamed protein product, partial [Didymodactylos carnosus]